MQKTLLLLHTIKTFQKAVREHYIYYYINYKLNSVCQKNKRFNDLNYL